MEKNRGQIIPSGILFEIQGAAETLQKKRILELVLAVALSIGLVGSLDNMLALGFLPQALGVSLAIVLIEFLAARKKAALIAVNAALAFAIIIAAFLIPDILADGFWLLANRLFALSEQNQAYAYDMLNIVAPEELHRMYMLASFLPVSAAISLMGTLTVLSGKKLPTLLIVLAMVFVQVYFGVFPAAGWCLYLCFALALTAACGRHIPAIEAVCLGIALCVLFLVVSGAVFAFAEGTNSKLSELSERIRDQFEEQIEQPIALAISERDNILENERQDMALNVDKVTDNPYQKAERKDFTIVYEERFEGAEIGWAPPQNSALLYILAIFGLIFAVAAVWLGFNLIKAARRRAGFRLTDSAAAIHNIFMYTLDWLRAHGLNTDSTVFSMYAEPVGTLISPEYSAKYMSAVGLWQEAVFSEHSLSEAQRTEARRFMEITKEVVWKRSNFADKARIKLKLFL